jgi:hypothetical protein
MAPVSRLDANSVQRAAACLGHVGWPIPASATIAAMSQPTAPASLPFTGDPEADALLAHEPMALLLGFVLDQQVSVQKAFSGPLELQRRIGTLDARAIAAMDPSELSEAFRERPALTASGAAAGACRRCAPIWSTGTAVTRPGLTDAREARPAGATACATVDRRHEGRSLIAILGKRFGCVPGLDDGCRPRPRRRRFGRGVGHYQASKRVGRPRTGPPG